jgi:uncharacterized C2H2 Zn-finger protein
MTKYECIKCNKQFNLKTDYERHLNKKFPCDDQKYVKTINNDMFRCINCGNKYKYKSDYIRHINKKISCDTIKNDISLTDDDISLIKTNYQCINCDKYYSTKYSLERHVNHFCKGVVLNDPNKLKEIILELKNELIEEKNKNKVSNMQSTGNVEINGNNNTATNTTNSNNITNNILINAYGKEDISHITDNDYKTLFTKCNSLIPMLIEMIHYNKDKPENTNVYISNIKSPHAYVYDGNKWILRNKSELIDDIYDNKCIIVIDKFDDMKKILNKNTIELFNKFIEKHDTNNMRKTASDKIELILYNNRDLIKNK